MPAIQDLQHPQIVEAIQAAVEKQVPVTVTVRSGDSDAWLNFHSRLIEADESHVLIEPPSAEGSEAPLEFRPADRIGVSFKLKHHKHVFNTTVIGTQGWRGPAGTPETPLLSICRPTKMQRLQRRAFQRVDVPPGKIVRGTFWLGGRKAEPRAGDPGSGVWPGQVTNISAGGVQMQVDPKVTHILEVGDVVGLRVVFGPGDATIYADAQFRHYDDFGDRAVIGFQLVGLTETPEGQQALRVLIDRVTQYGRYAQPRDE